jgi:sugar phosphate isomerase/epimerase
MRLGMCKSLESIEEVRDAGFDYIEPSCGTLNPDKDESEFTPVLKEIEKTNIPVEAFNGFIPVHLKVTGNDINLEQVEQYMNIVISRAQKAGASIIVFGSGGARKTSTGFPIDKAWSQLAEAARLAAQIAEKHNITIVMEPLCKRACNFFNRVDQGIDFVDRVNHPNLKLLADLYHFHDAGEPLENIVKAGKRLAHVHIATPALPEPKQGYIYDFLSFFKALIQAGYDGRISVEDNNHVIADKKPPYLAYYTTICNYLRSTLDEAKKVA